jgi:hypothetical protein
MGRAIGEIVGGGFCIVTAAVGFVGGGAASGTGVLTLPGVAVLVGSAALAAGGIANVASGVDRLGKALSMSSGSGSPRGTAPATHGVRVGGKEWKAFEPGTKACQRGCEGIATAIQKAIGGEIKVIRGPGKFLGKVRNSAGEFVNPAGDLAQGWRTHQVVVKDGQVYDAFTGPNGMAASAYKRIWEYGDALDFGF